MFIINIMTVGRKISRQLQKMISQTMIEIFRTTMNRVYTNVLVDHDLTPGLK